VEYNPPLIFSAGAGCASIMGGPSQRDAVRTLLFEGDFEDVHANAKFALRAVGGASDLPILDRAWTEKNGLVRNRAAEAIVRIKDARSS
jgi:hypothetical protein